MTVAVTSSSGGGLWAGARVEPGQQHGDVAVALDVGGEQAVDAPQDGADVGLGLGAGAQVGAGDGHEQGGPDAVAADVADGHAQAAVGQGQVVEVVAAD